MQHYAKIVLYQESQIPYFRANVSHVERIKGEFSGAEVVWCRSREEFEAELPGAEAVLGWAFRQENFAMAPQLKRVATPSAGRDFFKLEPPSGVEIRYSTFHGPIMGESVVGWMLAFNRGLLSGYKYQLEGDLWPLERLGDVRLLRGTHAVIVGFGAIGLCLSKLLKAFNVRVTGVRRNPAADVPEWFEPGDRVVAAGELDSVLPGADHLVLILPSDTGTDRMFDGERLSKLPDHCVIYNVGRGNCIDEGALAEALREGRLRGACLDVFADEPLTEASPLAESLPGLVRLPHATAFTERYLDLFLDEALPWLRGEGV